jgi:hypothetical protein
VEARITAYVADHASFPSHAGAYVFDIDGTLLVTRDLVHWNALHQAMLEAYGVDATLREFLTTE